MVNKLRLVKRQRCLSHLVDVKSEPCDLIFWTDCLISLGPRPFGRQTGQTEGVRSGGGDGVERPTLAPISSALGSAWRWRESHRARKPHVAGQVERSCLCGVLSHHKNSELLQMVTCERLAMCHLYSFRVENSRMLWFSVVDEV